jgi:hypothetical protein
MHNDRKTESPLKKKKKIFPCSKHIVSTRMPEQDATVPDLDLFTFAAPRLASPQRSHDCIALC